MADVVNAKLLANQLVRHLAQLVTNLVKTTKRLAAASVAA